MCEAGDLLGWRLETGDAVLGFEPYGEGNVRMTKSPSLTPELGRTEHFPFSIVRTYPIQVPPPRPERRSYFPSLV